MKGDKFAVIEHDRTQYIVVPGALVDVEKLDVKEGSEYVAQSVLLIKSGDEVMIGKPTVKGAKVVFEVKLHGKDRKVEIFKYKAKSRYRKTRGHKQEFTRLFVKSIEVDGKSIAKAESTGTTKKKVATKKTVKPEVKKAVAKKKVASKTTTKKIATKK